MFRNPHRDRLRKMFADQFEQDGESFLYRRDLKGAAIRVTQAERDEFVASFNRTARYIFWSLVPGSVFVIFLLAWLVPQQDEAARTTAVWIAVPAILIPFGAAFYRIWTRPARWPSREYLTRSWGWARCSA
ncbi:hypothetical protein [Allosphingosinicella indica]|uniref:hypothetical protein n=1 Tax=Allosphingosinicella indica TaxID=941907 RepID=UPI00156100F1|nr:hypothetical protein [Allosphingosinicella indica]